MDAEPPARLAESSPTPSDDVAAAPGTDDADRRDDSKQPALQPALGLLDPFLPVCRAAEGLSALPLQPPLQPPPLLAALAYMRE